MSNKNNAPITAKIDIKNMLKNEFCINIGGNPKLRNEIDKIFNKNKIEYLKAYKSSPIYKSKATEFCMADTYENILNLYKKAYKKIYH